VTAIQIPDGSGFGLDNLPYGVFSVPGSPGEGAAPRVGVRVGDVVLDLAAALDDDVFAAPTLNPFMGQGRAAWVRARERITGLLAGDVPDEAVHPLRGVTLHLPFTVADYVDFYACEQHASNAARIARPDGAKLPPSWKHLPVGYHGRAGTVVVSGTPVTRPCGQRGPGDLGPTRALDVEAELGLVCGGSGAGPVPLDEALDHVFGVVLLNDWSARDVQMWESRPLGPLLGKSFATSISAWVTPLDELAAAWADPPPRDPAPLPYLLGAADRGLDVALEIALNGEAVSRPPTVDLYWTPAQLVTHLTTNGAPLRPGDLLGSGTVSGARRDQRGSLLELTWGGTEPIALADGGSRTYLQDGDEVTISATAPAVGGGRLVLGEVRGRVTAAP
jgi:fumarylacetoacetase